MGKIATPAKKIKKPVGRLRAWRACKEFNFPSACRIDLPVLALTDVPYSTRSRLVHVQQMEAFRFPTAGMECLSRRQERTGQCAHGQREDILFVNAHRAGVSS